MQRSFAWDDLRSDYRHALDLESSAAVLAYWKWMPDRTHPLGDSTLPAGTTLIVLTAQGGEIHEVLQDSVLLQRLRQWPDRYVEAGTNIHDRVADQYAATLGLKHRIIRTSSLSARRAKNREVISGAQALHLHPEIEKSILLAVERRPGATVAEIAESNPTFTLQVLVGLLSLGKLFIDLENARLTIDDYDRIQLYRDAEQLEIDYAARLATSQIPVRSNEATLEPGTRVSINGEHHTVTQNAGEHVLLVSDRGCSRPFNRYTLAAMLAERKALAYIPTDAIRRQGAAKLRRATAAERNYSSERFREIAHLMKYIDKPAAARREGVLITERQARLLRRIRNTPSGNHPLVAFLPDYSRRGRRQLPAQVATLMDKILREAFSTPASSRRGRAHYFGQLVTECEKLNLKCPSEETFRTTWNRKSEDYEIHELLNEQDADKRTRSLANLLEERLQHAGHYGQLACIDSTKLPLVVHDSITGERLSHVNLSVMVDVYTRCTLAFHLDFAAPSAATALALLQTCVEKHGFLPQNIFCDNGPDLRADAFVEVLRNDRIGQFYRPPNQPKFCGLVESLLGRVQAAFFKDLEGCIKPRTKFAAKANLPDGCWDIWSLHKATSDLLYTLLPNIFHSGIDMRPADRRNRAPNPMMVRKVEDRDEFYKLTALSLPRITARVHPGRGVYVNNLLYHTTDFEQLGLSSPKVQVLHSPTDISRVWVESPKSGRFEEAVCSHYLDMSNKSGVERRMFTSELLARRAAIDKPSRRTGKGKIHQLIADAEQHLKARRERLAAQPAVEESQRSEPPSQPELELTAFPTEPNEIFA